MKPFILILSLCALAPGMASAQAVTEASPQAPEHFYNPPENLDPDPNYVPGDLPLQEAFPARAVYQLKKAELAGALAADPDSHAVTLGAGEISFAISKNEGAPVLGYFRDYFGVLKIGEAGPERMDIVIDVNSLDSAVPGRNNRILNIFFESAKPEFGTVAAAFDRFEFAAPFADWQEGEGREVTASGTITLNNVSRPLTAALNVQRTSTGWSVATAAPLKILISEFDFGNRVYDLMKSCNHKSMGNAVDVNVNLELR